MYEWCKTCVRKLLAFAIRDKASAPILIGYARGCKVPRDIAMANLSIVFGRYEKAVTNTLLSIEQDMKVVYDVGAHVGLTTLILAKRFGIRASIFAFEPSPQNVANLGALVTANGMSNVKIIQIALSDQCGNAKFLRLSASCMGKLDVVAAEDSPPSPLDSFDQVRTQTLDSFVFDDGQPPPDLIKIDVEGAEAMVLRGGEAVIAKFHPILLMELHGPKHAADVWDLLQNNGYQWTYIDPKVGLTASISDRLQLLGYFGPGDLWTQHVLLR